MKHQLPLDMISKILESLPNESILGVGCGAPLNFADLKEGETVVDLGSGAGMDCFLASKKVKESGKVKGIDFTNEMLNKARKASIENGFTNIEFKKGDIETGIFLWKIIQLMLSLAIALLI